MAEVPPGKHAPESPSSFYLSVARAVLGALAVLGVLIATIVVLINRGDDGQTATPRPQNSVPATRTPTTEPSATISSSPSASPSPSLRPRGKVTIVVLNATGRTGLAGRVQAKLDKAGYDVKRVGNYESTDKTTIFYRPGAKADAQALLDRYPELGRIKAADSSVPKDVLITIVLGSDYP